VLLIFFLSSRPNLHSPGPDFQLKDKVVHLVEYSVLGFLLWVSMARSIGLPKTGTFLFLLAVGASVAALDEVTQSYIPGRHMDVFDWTADALGLAAGLYLTAGAGTKKARTSPRREGGGHSGG
jgi:VanZ family protein